MLGRAGSGKTTFCLEEIKAKLVADPHGPPIIYLVPEQMTFQSEYELIRSVEIKGMIRAQVYSFTRLAWRVLQETKGLARHHLNRTGLHLVLTKIVERNKADLRVFARSAETIGFINQLVEMLAELKRYAVTPEQLGAEYEWLLTNKERTPQERLLSDKLHDTILVFRQLEKELKGRYLHREDDLHLLAEQLAQAPSLRGAEVYVDGFHRFTPQERVVIQSLLKVAQRVTVALTLDKIHTAPADPLDLFQLTGSTCAQILKLAEEADVPVEEPVILPSGTRFLNPALAHLEQQFEKHPPAPFQQNEKVNLWVAVNRRAEVEAVARELIRLVREEQYRWRDIVLLLRRPIDYHPLIETIFEDYQIPVFLDQKKSMLHHPLVELIRSSLEVIATHWRQDAVLRCLKTELLFPSGTDPLQVREAVDRLENIALAYGIQGERWYSEAPWPVQAEPAVGKGEPGEPVKIGRELDALRLELVRPLRRLGQELGTSRSVREMCLALYNFLEDVKAPQQLERWRDEALEQAELEGARAHEQVWPAIVDLLDQMVQLVGEEKLSFSLFRKMIESGLESLEFAQVPPALDQVLVADMEHSRLTGVKCAFILGVNEGMLPAKHQDEGLLSEEERDLLARRGLELAPGSRQKLLDEPFLIYMALSSPAERLYLSYPLADEEGEALLPSVVINRMKAFFPNLEERLITGEPAGQDDGDQLTYIAGPGSALATLATRLQAWARGEPIHPVWWDVYNWLITHPDWRWQARRVLSSLFYRNEAEALDEELSRSLYGERLRLSVSRMEKFQACPFSHFLAYGLKLKRRQIFRLEAPDIGQLFHAALNLMAQQLRRQGRDWASISNEECTALAGEMVERLAPQIQREILLSTNRHRYIKRKLRDVVSRAAIILREQALRSGFSPIGLEIGFGPGEMLPPLTIPLKNGISLEVLGRIDRVDQAEGKQGLYLRIIDYKSSARSLDLAEVYHGLSLQMLTYLDVVLTHAPEWLGKEVLPAGILYFHVHNPLVQSQGRLSPEEIEAELFKKFKMKGLLLADLEAVQLMDNSLESGYSEIIPVGLTKDHHFYSNSSVLSRDDLEQVRRYVRRKIGEIGQQLLQGVIAIAPYRYKEQSACTWCEYRSVCQFDEALRSNRHRILPAVSEGEVLQWLRSEAARSEGGELHGHKE